jgi:hypothetical protein
MLKLLYDEITFDEVRLTVNDKKRGGAVFCDSRDVTA